MADIVAALGLLLVALVTLVALHLPRVLSQASTTIQSSRTAVPQNEVREGSFGAAILCKHDTDKEPDTKARGI